jgi:hypothetical protein
LIFIFKGLTAWAAIGGKRRREEAAKKILGRRRGMGFSADENITVTSTVKVGPIYTPCDSCVDGLFRR